MKAALILDEAEFNEIPGKTDHDKLETLVGMRAIGTMRFIGVLDDNMMVRVLKSNDIDAPTVHYDDVFKILASR